MTRPLAVALVLSMGVMLSLAPSAEAKKRCKHSHVLACPALSPEAPDSVSPGTRCARRT